MIQDNININTNTVVANRPDFSLAINDFENEDHQAYMEEIGTLVFQSALMRFLVSESDEVAQSFENFIEKNVDSETFMQDLATEYPSFGQVLEEEMTAFSNQMKSL